MTDASIRLSSDQLAQMETLGYVVLENLFSRKEISELETHLGEFHRRHDEWLQANQGQGGISRAGEILFSDHIAEKDEHVRAFVKNEKMVALSTQILGSEVDLYWNQTVYKNPETSKEFPWHQDDAYTPVEPSPYLTCWLAVSDATTQNGCISVLPGSHVGGLRPHVETPSGWAGHPADDPDQGIKVPIPSGSMILFWSTVLHKSGPNLSNGMRKAYVIQYCPVGLKKIGETEPIKDLIPVARSGSRVD